jgi:hypothetical protein
MTKSQTDTNNQVPMRQVGVAGSIHWDFGFGICLVLGACDLELLPL